MNKYKESIIFKSLIITLVMTLLVPSFVKLAHAFENHKHEICVKPQKSHFHEYNLDCEFYKFKMSPQTAILVDCYKSSNIKKIGASIISQYQFISNYQQLSFSLRGPPIV